jgi:hypothetical protein
MSMVAGRAGVEDRVMNTSASAFALLGLITMFVGLFVAGSLTLVALGATAVLGAGVLDAQPTAGRSR